MRATTMGLVLAGLVGCGGDTLDGHVWTGTCDDDNGLITITTGTLAFSDGPIEGLEGEHERYRSSATLGFPGGDQDASLELAVCTDADGCADPLNDFEPDAVVAYFQNAAGELSLLGIGSFDGKKAVTGTCSVYGSAKQTFAMEQSKD